jgi:hypothetical protein
MVMTMRDYQAAAEYPGRIKSLKDAENILQVVEYILPYGLAKVYMTANRRWCFLEKDRRKKATAHLMNRVIRRFACNIWDIRSSNGGFIEDFHTIPIIGIIDVIVTEYARQRGLVSKDASFAMATFKLCACGYISADQKSKIDELHELKRRRDLNLTPLSKNREGKPALYDLATKTLYELEEKFITIHMTEQTNRLSSVS